MTGENERATSAEFLTRREEGVVTVTINRPARKNAVTTPGWRELLDVLRTINPLHDRVLVITGAGTDFCAGNDLGTDRSHPDRNPVNDMRTVGAAALALHTLPIPTVARVDGVAVGAGMNLALACDFVVCSDRARFSEIFVKRGLSIDFGGSWILPRLVGLRTAKQLTLLGDMIDAPTALELGLVHTVIAQDKLDAAIDELVEKLRSGPPIATSLSKAMLNEAFDVTLAQALDHEGWAQSINSGTQDAREAARAFFEKRAPRFQGR